ncbi:inovirus-type Gp2 protein [Psychromonas sp.]|uniref:YagK/YfjJ domain-containing protein n=1 Tax=Psychromonas sp. TaxID=1884585 RepID=UPI00356710FA
MSNKEHSEVDKLTLGYFGEYQVNIDMGELSLTFLDELANIFEQSLQRFPDCYVFRFRLGFPKTFNGDAEALLNTLFYSLANQFPEKAITEGELKSKGNTKPVNEDVNMIWAKDVTAKGLLGYRVAFIFSAVSYRAKASLEQVREHFKQRVKITWANALLVHESQIHTLCIFPPDSLIPLKAEQSNYQYETHRCFYFLSTLAKLPRYPVEDLSTAFGVKFSKQQNQDKKELIEQS